MFNKENFGIKKRPMKDGVELDDDEPIGSLFKLKMSGNPKRRLEGTSVNGEAKMVESRSDKAVIDELDFGGMDDTLAIFRKKLKKGPKIQSRSTMDGSTEVNTSHMNASKAQVMDIIVSSEMVDRGSRCGSKGKVQRSKILAVPNEKVDCGESDIIEDEDLDDSLLEFVRKTQIKQTRNYPTLKMGFSPISPGISPERELMATSMKSENNLHQVSGIILVGVTPDQVSNLENKALPNVLCEDSKYRQDKFCLFTDTLEMSSSVHVAKGDSLAYTNHGIYKSFEPSLEDLVAPCPLTESHFRKSDIQVENSHHGLTVDPFEQARENYSAPIQRTILVTQSSENGLKYCSTEKVSCMDQIALVTSNGLSDSARKHTPKNIYQQFPPFLGESLKIQSQDVSECSLQMEDSLKFGIHVGTKEDNFSDSKMDTLECTIQMNNEGKCLEINEILNQSSQIISRAELATSVQKDSSTFLEKKYSYGAGNDIVGPIHSEDIDDAAFLSKTLPDPSESYQEVSGTMPDPEGKYNKLLVHRGMHKDKKCKHRDIAFEGDAYWDSLIHEQDFVESHIDQSSGTLDKFDYCSNIVVESKNVEVAAISSGLKVHCVCPVEKIIFKEILKHKAGLQEYLECRNQILGLWNRDVTRILLPEDCGLTNTFSEHEFLRNSLIREVYNFLDHRGYINFGISSKNFEERNTRCDNTLVKERKLEENNKAPDVDSDGGVSSILGRDKGVESVNEPKNDVVFDDENLFPELGKGRHLVVPKRPVLSFLTEPDECATDDTKQNGCIFPIMTAKSDFLFSDPSSEVLDCGRILFGIPDPKSNLQNTQHIVTTHALESDDTQHSYIRKRIIVIGAGPAGLTAARHLKRQGFSVIVLEGRSRIGGRVYTDHSSLSVPVDLGASIITGVEADVTTERRPDPSSLICAQLGLKLTVLNSECPLYDIVTSQKVPAVLDETLEAEFNGLLDDMVFLVAHKGEQALKMSLEDGLEYALKNRRLSQSRTKYDRRMLHSSMGNNVVSEKIVGLKIAEMNSPEKEILSPLERRVMDWHFANLEYGCAALLREVSLPYWNQDDVYGGFGGAHCMIQGGYSKVIESLGEGLHIHLNHVVTDISYATNNSGITDLSSKVKVLTSNGSEFSGDAVLITVPLGCLKAETIHFSPELPQWKRTSVQRLGFGVLNKVVLEFPEVFWDDSVDYFGATSEKTNQRGQCFMFWNVRKTVGAPVLIALLVGKAAIEGQNLSTADHAKHAVSVLRKLFGESTVPDPIAQVVTDWGRDPFSFGAYSYVAVGSSGEDYDILGRPVENCLFFAGEATCKEHPDTVGGAMISGLREAVRIIDILVSGCDYAAEVEAVEAIQNHSDCERGEVKDIMKRLDAVEFSKVLYRNSFEGGQVMNREAMLRDMFRNARTTAGRLHLAKNLLNLPAEALKSFAGTKNGLSILNSWILDSMGKDGTQLLRHCVRILVLVSTDLLAVRSSGIGKTVKEKVCVHTSRDIRSVASQLVSIWIEVFRKEKASNVGFKLLKRSTIFDSSKTKSVTELAPGKPPLRIHHCAPENKESGTIIASAISHSSSKSNYRKLDSKANKMDPITDPMSEINSSRSQSSAGNLDFTMSEEELAAFAAAETARAAALAAAQAYASSEARNNTLVQLPKIPSFHKFARREQYAQMDESDARRKWGSGFIGQDCLSEIDSRNCRVRDWSVDFSAACVNLDRSRTCNNNQSHQNPSSQITCPMSLRENTGENVAIDNSVFTKAWVDADGSEEYSAINMWQSQAITADLDSHASMHIMDEEDSNVISRPLTSKPGQIANESSLSHLKINNESAMNPSRGAERIKQAVVDYVASLLMPLYKARKIDKDGYKSIMKKTATKVMKQTTDAEKGMFVSEFLDLKRKNKIRSFVDTLIEKHMGMKPVVEHR